MNLLLYLVVLILGFLLGNYLRKKHSKKIPYSHYIQLLLIYANIVVMGIRIGMREEIMDNIFTIGISSLIFTVLILICAIIMMNLGRRFLGFDKLGVKHKNKNFLVKKEETIVEKIKNTIVHKKTNSNSMTIIILICAAMGILLGRIWIYEGLKNGTICNGDMLVFESFIAKFVDVFVGTLIFLVGVDLGFDGKAIENIKKAGLLIILFPILNIIGSTIGAIIASFICRIDLMQSITIGNGYAWFSIAPSLILKYELAEAAAISFLHNVLREVLAFIFIPIVANKIGQVESICMPGAAAMDDCLPLIEQSTSPAVAIYGFVSGVLLTALVPSLTTFFASLAAA